jgi:hypothetical protein
MNRRINGPILVNTEAILENESPDFVVPRVER